MPNVVQQSVRDDRGLETVEYAIVVGIIVGGLVLALAAIGSWVNSEFGELNNELSSIGSPVDVSGKGNGAGFTGGHGKGAAGGISAGAGKGP